MTRLEDALVARAGLAPEAAKRAARVAIDFFTFEVARNPVAEVLPVGYPHPDMSHLEQFEELLEDADPGLAEAWLETQHRMWAPIRVYLARLARRDLPHAWEGKVRVDKPDRDQEAHLFDTFDFYHTDARPGCRCGRDFADFADLTVHCIRENPK